MIRQSPELAAIVERWNAAVIQRDGETLRNLLSTQDALHYVGSAEGESWSGQVLRDGIADHFREIPDFEQGPAVVEAYENGETGWAHWSGSFTFSGSTNVTAVHRITFVFVLEAGAWKIAHIHISNPMSNVEKMGIEHQALNALVEAAREGFRLDQREGMASIMFTDIANSTAITSVLGDAVWAGAVRDHLAMVGAVVASQGGQLVKSLGDGTMSSFSSAREALAAAVEIQRRNADPKAEPPLSLRIGIHSGEVIQTEDDFFGTVVNKAARIAVVAAPEQIRVSDATRVMVGRSDEFEFADAVALALRGLEGEHLIYRLEWRA